VFDKNTCSFDYLIKVEIIVECYDVIPPKRYDLLTGLKNPKTQQKSPA